MSPSPPSFPSSPSRWLLHLHPPRSCQSLSLCSHHATVTGIWFPSSSVFLVCVCVCELPLSHLFHQLSGGYAHQSKSSALLSSSCVCVRVREEWVGHQSRLRDGMNIKFKKKMKPHIVQLRLPPISPHWNVSYSIHIFISHGVRWCVFVPASFHCTASPF